MKREGQRLGHAAMSAGENMRGDVAGKAAAAAKRGGGGLLPRDAIGLDDAMLEGIYGQAYRLYNTGKYGEAAQLFRLLLLSNSLEPRYAMGLAASFHMAKEYQHAIDGYTLCSIVDPDSPLPQYHAADCYIHLGDKMSAAVALQMAVKRAGSRTEFRTLVDRANLMIEGLKKGEGK